MFESAEDMPLILNCVLSLAEDNLNRN